MIAALGVFMKKAIVLLNMGGPNNLDEVGVFLNNMFNDKRIIGAPKLIRKLIAKFITYKRLNEAKENYKALGGKSPIVGYTQKLVEKLERVSGVPVRMAMRYTPPYATQAVQELRDVDTLYAIPLYPHYSSTTTLSSLEDLEAACEKLGFHGKIVTTQHYYADSLLNQAIVKRIQEALKGDDASDFELVFSAHGLPKKIIEKGDLYQKQIRANLYFARKALLQAGVHFHKTHLAYQSRLGPLEWIRPYLEDKLKALKKKKVIIYPIAFTVDNSETEFELEVEYREKAEAMGFEEYRVAKVLNDDTLFVAALDAIYRKMAS